MGDITVPQEGVDFLQSLASYSKEKHAITYGRLAGHVMNMMYGTDGMVAKAIVPCAHCGQWAARFGVCKHCGAPIN